MLNVECNRVKNPFFKMSETNSAQFEYTITHSNEKGEKFPPQTLINKENGETIYYFDLLNRNRLHEIRPKDYVIKIAKKSGKSEKLLIHFKLGFFTEKYRENELATINQWKQWHETTMPNGYNVDFFTVKPTSKDATIKDLGDPVNTAPNVKTFLWEVVESKSLQPPNSCEFTLNFGCHSTQFPILLDNYDHQYGGSQFVLSIDVYSVASKHKLITFSLKLKISRIDSSEFKLDSGKGLTAKNDQENPDPMEQNLKELMASLSNAQQGAPLPTYEQLKAVQLKHGLFSYRSENIKSIIGQDKMPIMFLKQPIHFDHGTRHVSFEVGKSNFDKFHNKNELLKTVLTLELKPTVNKDAPLNPVHKDITIWQQNWQRSNQDKVLLKFGNFNSSKIGVPAGENLFDVYSPSIEQICLTWMPSNENGGIEFSFNICDNGELEFVNNFDAFLRVETFVAAQNAPINEDGLNWLIHDEYNWTRIDAAVCRLNFVDQTPTTAYDGTWLKNYSDYLIKKAIFISVNGSAYEQLLLQKVLVNYFSADQFKDTLIAFVRKIGNMDSQFEIKELNYYESDQHKDYRPFGANILACLKPKAILKCNLRKVVPNVDEENSEEEEQPKLDQYNVDLINQDENYSKEYI